MPGELQQEQPVTGANFQHLFSFRAGAQQQLAGLLGILPVLGDQLLLGIMLFGVPGKKGAALLGTLLLHLFQSRRDFLIEGPIIQLVEQGAVNGTLCVIRLGQATTVENGVALTALFHQSAFCQHLEVVAHAGLLHGHDLAQLQHPEAVLAQHLQYLQA